MSPDCPEPEALSPPPLESFDLLTEVADPAGPVCVLMLVADMLVVALVLVSVVFVVVSVNDVGFIEEVEVGVNVAVLVVTEVLMLAMANLLDGT